MEGWFISGYAMILALEVWAGLVLLHVVWRVAVGPENDPPRPAGPIGWE